MKISVPFLKRPIGAGDAIKAATSKVGIKPCAPCEQRAQRMNRVLTFVPRHQPVIDVQAQLKLLAQERTQTQMQPDSNAYFQGCSEIFEYIVRSYKREDGSVHLSPEDHAAVRSRIAEMKAAGQK